EVLAGEGEGNVRFRMNTTGIWNFRNSSLAWTTRVLDSYCATPYCSGTFGRVRTQNYHDLSFSVHSQASSGIFANSAIEIGVRNLSNRQTPVDLAAGSSSPLADPRGRMYFVMLRKFTNPRLRSTYDASSP